MNEILLPSGAKLTVSIAPFAKAKAFYQAVLEEFKGVNLDPKADVDVNLFKDLFCAGFSSKKVEETLYVCMERATYNGARIKDIDATFESEEARQDYMVVCWEVAQANLLPFTKGLSQRYTALLGNLPNSPTQK